jgi:hypothetical protein
MRKIRRIGRPLSGSSAILRALNAVITLATALAQAVTSNIVH